MSDPRAFQVANPNIIHDTIEGEVILLNLDTGTYYQLRNTGVAVWNALVQGYSTVEIEKQFAKLYPNDSRSIQPGISQFIDELEQEGLIAPRAAENSAQNSDPLTLGAPTTPNGSFEPPLLLKYTDMQSLLLLDPIHDVDSQGWPILKPDDPPV